MLITFGGWVVALGVAVVGAFVHWRKAGIDESALVLGKWKELVDTHQTQITMMQTRIDTLTAENTDLRTRLAATEKEFADYRRKTDDEIAGLKRAIIQNSQSAAMVIGKGKE